ncbi:Ig-like domain-containing protein [Bacillus salipaludis]|uniref:Ig-like domain-containing protein n=1 Tax=Bacillus salipaludis TaxID=2547811 RepID=UPI003D1E32A7
MIEFKKIGSLIAFLTMLIIGGQLAKAETPYDSLKGQIEKDKGHSVQVHSIDGLENSQIDRILKSQIRNRSDYKTQALTGNTYYESEPNNYIYNANILNRGDMVLGTFGLYDVDTYEMTITQPGYVAVSAVMDKTSLSEIGLILNDPYDNLIYSDDMVQEDNTVSKLFYLQPGTYYISTLDMMNYATGDTYGLAWDVVDLDKTSPSAPTVNRVDDNDTVLTGTAEAGSLITVKAGLNIIGTTVTNNDGRYSVSITRQKAGTKLVVTATDDAGNVSNIREVIVKDVTPPITPTMNSVFDNSSEVKGKAESNAKVYVMVGSKKIGQGTAKSGVYTIKIAKQKAGTIITVYAVDTSGNKSGNKTVKVIDKTPPAVPTVSKITSKSKTVSGKAERGATIYLYNGNKRIGKGTVDSRGYYKVKIKAQKKGSKIKVYAIDKAGNKSKSKTIKMS